MLHPLSLACDSLRGYVTLFIAKHQNSLTSEVSAFYCMLSAHDVAFFLNCPEFAECGRYVHIHSRHIHTVVVVTINPKSKRTTCIISCSHCLGSAFEGPLPQHDIDMYCQLLVLYYTYTHTPQDLWNYSRNRIL